MTTKQDITNNTGLLQNKLSPSELLSLKISNAPYRKSAILGHPSIMNKNGVFLNSGNAQESNPYNNTHSLNPYPSLLGGNSKKSPVKPLVIDTNDEASKYVNSQSNHFGPYSTINNASSAPHFPKNPLISSLSGNLTSKFGRASESFKPTFILPNKNSSSNKLLLASINVPSSSANQAAKENIPPVTNLSEPSVLDNHNLNHLASKKNLPRYFSLESNKTASGEGKVPELKAVSPINPLQKEKQPLTENNSLPNGRSITPTCNSTSPVSINENIPTLMKGNITPNSSQPTLAQKLATPIPNHEPTKCSAKRNGIVKAYAANTNQGIVRNYNEDRVSIILNIMKPASRVNEDWPKCSFFGVYDGHGGVSCADFLRDNLHQYVIKEPSFPWNAKEALTKGFEAAEKAFVEFAQNRPNGEIDRSGSCAIVVLIIGDMCYVANVGDSRAVMSANGGTRIFSLSKDHKPNEDAEQKRITEAGGKIYQTQSPAFKQVSDGNSTKPQMQLMLGPHRVFPGRLSVSRTFGDIEAKLPKYGGNPNVVIAVPDIKAFKISNDHDFIVLASDGIYDKLSTRDVIKSVWESTVERADNVHQQCVLGVENILREAINRRTLDNITVVMICFKNFKYNLFSREKAKKATEENTNTNITENAFTSKSGGLNFATRGASQNQRERLTDQENMGNKASPNSLVNDYNARKTPNSLSENNSTRTSLELKRPQHDNKAENSLSDSNMGNKKTNSKRGASSLGINDNYKLDPLHQHLHNLENVVSKSMSYKNGEIKFRGNDNNK